MIDLSSTLPGRVVRRLSRHISRRIARVRHNDAEPVRFSIVLPIYNSDPAHLGAQLDAITAQTHLLWECVVVDDGSSDAHGREVASRAAAADERFRLHPRLVNGGIAAATNDGIAAARFEWIVFCDHDDLLLPPALAALADHISHHPVDDIIYSDEMVIDERGDLVVEYRKPDYSPERLLGHNYFCHVVTVRRSLIDQIGGLDPAFEPVADNDFDLRAAAAARSVGHVAEVLYGWRSIPGSLATAGDAKVNVQRAVVASAAAHIDRTGDVASATPSPDAPTLVRIERPTATVPVFELTIDVSTTVDEIRRAVADTDLPYVALSVPGVLGAWYAPLVSLCVHSRCEMVGPKLVTADGRLVSAGRVHSPGVADLHQGIDADNHGPWGAYCVNREVSSLAAPGVVFDRVAVLALGGFDIDVSAAELVGLDPAVLLDLTMAVLGTRLWERSTPAIWSPLVTVVVDDEWIRDDVYWSRLAVAQRTLSDHLPRLLDDPFSPIGSHRS